MKIRTLKELVLYNYRYLFAYVAIVVFGLYFLCWRLGSIAPGLSQVELTSATRHLQFSTIAGLPIYPLQSLLQWTTMHVAGISPYVLRLPSAIIAALTAFCLYYILKRWFGKPSSLLTIALLLSADWFLFIGRLGVGSIEFSLWLSLAVICLIKLLEHKSVWLIGLAVAVGGLLFCPYGPYAAIVITACLFRFATFRHRAMEASVKVKVLSIATICIILLFAGLTLLSSTAFIKSILGLSALPTFSEYFRNLVINSSSFAVVFPGSNPIVQPHGLFFVRFFEAIFILFGAIMLWRTRVNRLNVVILILSVTLALLSGLNSGSRGGSLLIVPASVFMTAGICHYVHRWQRTFPKNPYARMAALLPLSAIFICVVALHYQSYFVLWPGQTSTSQVFSQDFSLLKSEFNKPQYRNQHCLLTSNDPSLKALILAAKTTCQPVISPPISIVNGSFAATVIPSGTPLPVQSTSGTLRPLVSSTKDDNVRWLVLTP